MSDTDKLQRHTPENPFNYTAEEILLRKKALREMEKDYPNLPFAWLEMVYDFHKNTSAATVSEIINKRTWEVPGKFSMK